MEKHNGYPEAVIRALEDNVKKGKVPRYLYKYTSIKNARKILRGNSLWFSSFEDFNDPFDCQGGVINIDSKTDEVIRYLLDTSNGILTLDKKYALIEDALTNPNFIHDFFVKSMSNTISQYGICCFSKRKDHILLWSHYAEQHKGVCLKFDVLECLDVFLIPLIVEYQRKLPTLNFVADRQDVNTMVKTKSKEWSYENEVRILKREGKGKYRFKKSALKELIFGCRCPGEIIGATKILVEKKGYKNIKFKQAKIKADQFGLDIASL